MAIFLSRLSFFKANMEELNCPLPPSIIIKLGKEPSGPGWDAWKAFFVSGFAAQKMVFLPKGASADSKETYQNAFERVVKRADFKKISENSLGVYDQMTKKAAGIAAGQATDVSDEARAFVKEWLKTDYNVNL